MNEPKVSEQGPSVSQETEPRPTTAELTDRELEAIAAGGKAGGMGGGFMGNGDPFGRTFG